MTNLNTSNSEQSVTAENDRPSFLNRWISFALRRKKLSAFLLILVLCLSWKYWGLCQRQWFINDIRARGGQVGFSKTDVPGFLRRLPGHIVEAGLNIDAVAFPNSLPAAQADDVFNKMYLVPEVRTLYFTKVPVSNQSLALLSNTPQLYYLNLSTTTLQCGFMKELALNCPHLKELSLRNAKVKCGIDQELKDVARFDQLQGLILDGTSVSDEALAALRKALPNLTIHND